MGEKTNETSGSNEDTIQRGVFRGLLLFATISLTIWAFGLILVPFLVPIAWALCLAALTAPAYRRLAARWRRPKLTAALMVTLVAILILGPIVGVCLVVIEEATEVSLSPLISEVKEQFPSVYHKADEMIQGLGLPEFPPEKDAVKHLSVLAEEHLPTLIRTLFAGPLARGALMALRLPFVFLFELVLVLITLYFVYCESGRLRRIAIDISPLEPAETDLILETLRGTTTAAVLGGVVVALVQGLLGGLMFAIAGVPSPALWGLLMAALSLLPFGGTAIVWLPAGLYMLMTGDTGWGIFVLAFGAIIVGGVDNVMRPWLLSKAGVTKIHPMMLFFAVISGIGIFGISGIVFGPLLLAFLMTMLQIYRWHFAPSRRGADSGEMARAELEKMKSE